MKDIDCIEIKEKVSVLVSESENELLTPAEVCKMLKISRNTYQRYVEAGVFEQLRINKKQKKQGICKTFRNKQTNRGKEGVG